MIELVRPDGIDERIAVLRCGDEVDSFVVHTARFTVLVDTFATPALCREAVDLLPDGPLLVVNTHADWDHAWGNAVVADRAPILAHAAALVRYRDEASRRLTELAAEQARFRDVELVAPTMTFTERLTIDGGDLTVQLVPTPGHTPDHVAVWIPQLATVLAGDAAEDPLPELWQPTAPSLAQLRSSLHVLGALEPRHVLPAHGRSTDGGLIARNLGFFDELATRIAALAPAERADPHLSERPGLTLTDLVPSATALPAPAAEFYRSCHERAVAAMREPI